MNSQDISIQSSKEKLQQYFEWANRLTRQNPWLSGFLGFCMMVFLLWQMIFWSVQLGAFGPLPDNRMLLFPPIDKASEIYSVDGEILGRVYLKDRTLITDRDLPVHLTEALIATEDARFYTHDGVDIPSLGRVLIKNILMGEKSAGGGSTLSQQLAKLWFQRERGNSYIQLVINKIREMLVAEKIEQLYPKDQIIVQYFNTVFLGEQAHGIEAAAYRYFGKETKALTIEEGATLIGILRAPSYYNPYRHQDRAQKRRDVVLSQMLKYDYLDSVMYDSLKSLPLVLDYHPPQIYQGAAPHFRAEVTWNARKLLANYPKPGGGVWDIYTDGLKIVTTLDSRLQSYAEAAVQAHMPRMQRKLDAEWRGWARKKLNRSLLARHRKQLARNFEPNIASFDVDSLLEIPRKTRLFTWEGWQDTVISPLDSMLYAESLLQTGLLAMAPQTGQVQAWVGGIDFYHGQFDHVRAHRQGGSIFKPVVMATALESGIAPCDFVKNEQKTYQQYGNWSPENADAHYGGQYSMRGALTHSVNVVAVSLLMQMGAEKVVDMAHKLGIEGEIPPVPSIALGTADVSLKEMVGVYAAIVNKGQQPQLTSILRIEGPEGELIYEHEPVPAKTVMQASNAQALGYMMEGVVEQGTGRSLRSRYHLKSDLAGKTGTTQLQTDGWFIGMTPALVTGVWVGADDPQVHFRTMAGQGASTALPIFGKFMQAVEKDSNFVSWKNATFESLPPQVASTLDCDEYAFPVAMSEFKAWWEATYGVDSTQLDSPQVIPIETFSPR
ncbi:MAG: transglycosylase domain-containing protein [Bacteroidota bacterium]